MKKSKASLLYIMMVLLAAGFYSAALFLLKKDFTVASWISYGFTMLAFLVLLTDVLLSGGGEKRYPILQKKLSVNAVRYFLTQFVLGGVVAMFIKAIDATLVLVAEGALFAVYLLTALSLKAKKQTVEAQDDHSGAKVLALRTMKNDLNAIASVTDDSALRKEIIRLAEDVGYSDPMSADALCELEESMRNNVAMLREEIDEGNSEKANARLRRLRVMLNERNAQCAAPKRG